MKTHGLLVALLLALFATAIPAQDAGEQQPEKAKPKPFPGPRSVWVAFYKSRRQAKAAEGAEREALLTEAGSLFDLSGVNPADRDRTGRQAADKLKAFLDRVATGVNEFWYEPETLDGDKYAWDAPDERGTITMTRGADGNWRFSAETLAGVDDLFENVRKLKPKASDADEHFLDESTIVYRYFSGWWLNRLWVLQNWQWMMLLALILAGVFAGAIFRFLVMAITRRWARSRGVELSRGRRTGRPFALVAMAGVWFWGVPYLALPQTFDAALIGTARVVLMVGAVWASCRVIDILTEAFAGMAARTTTKLDDLLVPMLRRAVKIFIVVLGIVWIADNLGMNVGALLAGLGIGGIAIALASKDTVENFFGAISILVDRPFQVGDWVRIGAIEGTISEVGFRSSRVRTFYDSIITFPNALLIRTPVDNLGRRRYRRIKTTLGIAYDTPAAKLEAFLEGMRELIRIHPYTRKDYYLVNFSGFGDSALEILLYCFVETPDWQTELREKQRLLLDIKRLAETLGIEFAFPTRTLHMIEAKNAQHDEATDVGAAQSRGRRTAQQILDEFTGSKTPPPLSIQRGPSELDSDSGGE